MITRRGVLLGGLVALAGCGGGGSGESGSVGSVLEAVRTETGVPGLAGALITSSRITPAVLGRRVQGGSVGIASQDRFHIGSCTKSLTATLAALLVQEGKLRWETTVGEAFPERAWQLHPAYALVTLEVLLAHRSGLASFEGGEELLSLAAYTGTPPEQRLALAQALLTQHPAGAFGEFLYSNVGYGIAGAMLERAAGSPWETLVRERVLLPLGTDAKLGWPGEGGVPAPWGHLEEEGAFVPHDPSDTTHPYYRFFESVSPAGNVSQSVEELARYVQLHLRGLMGQSVALSPASLTRLHTGIAIPGTPLTYALGWVERTVAGVATSLHTGSADTFYAVMVIQPARGLAAVSLINAGGPKGESAAYAVVERLLETTSLSGGF